MPMNKPVSVRKDCRHTEFHYSNIPKMVGLIKGVMSYVYILRLMSYASLLGVLELQHLKG